MESRLLLMDGDREWLGVLESMLKMLLSDEVIVL
jgi:hypothetical protein